MLAPNDPSVAQTAGEIALALGRARPAADGMDEAFRRVVETAQREQRPPDEQFILHYAEALAGDGALRVPDPESAKGLRYRYDIAAGLLEGLMSRKVPESRAPLYHVYLRYGDMLRSLDRPAMALIAYERAHHLTGSDTKQAAYRHGQWLSEQLAREETAARADLAAAKGGQGAVNVADAFVELYTALCRQGVYSRAAEDQPKEADPLEEKRREAEAIFAKLENDLGGIPPKLRFCRAVQRYAALDVAENQQTAETELRQVIREDPEFARAHFELARVLEWEGTVERLSEARAEYEAAARLGIAEEWSLEASERARVLDRIIEQAK
jgi:tetratricopeptide (TPR) repeat protein